MKLTIIGTGYVGLVAGACFADLGHEVICLDQNPEKISLLKQGKIPIYEPGLEEIVQRNKKKERLQFTTSFEKAIPPSEIIFLAVGTPSLPSGSVDLSSVKAASQELGAYLKSYKIIVNKSTVPLGSHQKVAQWIQTHTNASFDVVSNPEFLKEGSAIEDFMHPNRILIGTDQKSVFEKMASLYEPLTQQGVPLLWMDPLSSELCKYASNSFLATRISFINELACLCEQVGADIESVRQGMGLDARIGKHFLRAGIGFGGSCFPKDLKALLATSREQNTPLSLLQATLKINETQKMLLFKKIQRYFKNQGQTLQGKCFAILGAAFKPQTDDIREAPSLTLIQALKASGAQIQLYDPIALPNVEALFGNEHIRYCNNPYLALKNADAMVLVTEWNEFKNLDFQEVKKLLKNPILFDGRNLYPPQKMQKLGFYYEAIGRNTKPPSKKGGTHVFF